MLSYLEINTINTTLVVLLVIELRHNRSYQWCQKCMGAQQLLLQLKTIQLLLQY